MKARRTGIVALKWSAGLLLLLGLVLAALGRTSFAGAKAGIPSYDKDLPLAALLPASTCIYDSNANTRTCELWAKVGTLSLPGPITVPIWGFSDSSDGAAQSPGPSIVANEGENLRVILHNELAWALSLDFTGQAVVPDMDGAAPGTQTTYEFPLLAPGTYLYQAGLTPNGPRQVTMGLFGALVIRPAGQPQWAYDGNSAFDSEALLVMSEIDPAFNADPLNFSLINFQPKYFLINGKAFPDTEAIAISPNQRALLRQINTGPGQRSLGLLGMHQKVLAQDGNLYPYPYEVVAETLSPGQTLDTLVTAPLSVVAGGKYALYEAGMRQHNSNQRPVPGGPVSFGGILTFLTVSGDFAVPAGPLANNLLAVPNQSAGPTFYNLTATITDLTTGGQNVVAAEYFINSVGAPGSGTLMSGAFGSITVPVSAAIPVSALAALGSDQYIIYVRGQDAGGLWGAVNSVLLPLDTGGPIVSGLLLSPNPTNGSANVNLTGTASDVASGNSNVAAAEYSIDGGTSVAASLNTTTAPVAAISATIPVGTVAALSEGVYVISVRAQDVTGNWGNPATINLLVDKTGPDTSDVSLAPNALDLSGNVQPLLTVRLLATLNEPVVNGVRSNVLAAEYFFDTARAPGSGAPLISQDGQFNGPTEIARYDVPIANFGILAQGTHTVLVRGKDSAGNWGATASASFTVDKGQVDTQGPLVDTVTLTPNPSAGAPAVTLQARAADPDYLSNLAAGEWFIGADPGLGNGNPMTASDGLFDQTIEQMIASVDVSGLTDGDYSVSIRARDAQGLWGATVTVTLRRTTFVQTYLPIIKN
ncbi:MAG: multicopper oxidase domain-containing protein [Anaerolineae bacterium]